jgi:hypothetical protein
MFPDATPYKDDPAALCQRIREDGFLFFPGLLDSAVVDGVRADVTEVLADQGWLAPDTDPLDAVPGPTPRKPGDDGWFDAYTRVIGAESFNRLPHSPALASVARNILGPDTIAQPMKIARITYPGSQYPTPPHQDFFFVRGTPDVLTAWIPLGDCPADMGGLRVLPGSHHDGLRAVKAAHGAGGISAEVDEDDPRWRGPVDYRAGDVLVFHSLLVHNAPPNQGERLRLSGDFRFQSASDPITPAALYPHSCGEGVPPWWYLTGDWSSTEWIDVPYPVHLATWRPDFDDVPPSRLL